MADAEDYEMHDYETHQDDDDDYQDAEDGGNEEQDDNVNQPSSQYGETSIVLHDNQIAETSFTKPLSSDALDRIVNTIEDENLKDKVKFTLEADKNNKGEASGETLKNALLDGISDLNLEDRLFKQKWDAIDEKLNLEENEKFEYEQKLANVNKALEDENIFIDNENVKAYEFIKNFEETYTGELGMGKGEINGYKYNNEKIIKRTYTTNDEGKRVFKFIFLKNEKAIQVIDHLDDLSKLSFKDQLISKIGSSSNIKIVAENYIEELRNIEKQKIKNAEKIGELKERIRTLNKTNEEIQEIKENNPVKIDEDVLEKSLKGRVARFLEKYKGNFITYWSSRYNRNSSVYLSVYFRGRGNHKTWAKKIGELGEMMEKSGKLLRITSKKLNKHIESPLNLVSDLIRISGYLTKETAQNPIIIVIIIIILVLVYIIKWNVRLIRRR